MKEKNIQLLSDIYEASLRELDQETKRGFPDTDRENSSNKIRIKKMSYDVVKQGNDIALLVKGTSSGTKEDRYSCNVMVINPIFDEVKNPDNIEIQIDDEPRYIKPFLDNQLDVKVSCSCLDFRFRFATQNFENGTLYGAKPDPYVRKTNTRGPANPLDVIGMCKHLYALRDEMELVGIIS